MKLWRTLTRIGTLALILLLATTLGLSQTTAKKPPPKKMTRKDLPAAVVTNFDKSYPTAGIRKISIETKDGIKYFEIETSDGKINRNLLYAADGSVKELEESVPRRHIPEAIKQGALAAAPNDSLVKVEKVMRDGVVTFEVIVAGPKGRHELVLSPEGKLVQSEEKSEKLEKKAEKGEPKEKATKPTHK
jgi:hypothetical protein